MGSSDDLKSTLERLTAKIEELSTDVRVPKPLAPIADKLAAVPDQIVCLQSSAYDNTEQVHALNLTVIHVEKSQHVVKGVASGDVDGRNNSVHQPPLKAGFSPPPPDRPTGRCQSDPSRRATSTTTTGSTRASASSFRCSTARRTRSHGSC
jgi:hypothetical protein